eukprot:COSAG05_NODE_5240_length_1228_cov_1.886625_1_plen_263_part_10
MTSAKGERTAAAAAAAVAAASKDAAAKGVAAILPAVRGRAGGGGPLGNDQDERVRRPVIRRPRTADVAGIHRGISGTIEPSSFGAISTSSAVCGLAGGPTAPEIPSADDWSAIISAITSVVSSDDEFVTRDVHCTPRDHHFAAPGVRAERLQSPPPPPPLPAQATPSQAVPLEAGLELGVSGGPTGSAGGNDDDTSKRSAAIDSMARLLGGWAQYSHPRTVPTAGSSAPRVWGESPQPHSPPPPQLPPPPTRRKPGKHGATCW